jgi:acyl carrier protein
MLETTVIEVIANHLNCKPSDISADSRLDDLGIDSLGAITILYELEDRFDIEIPNEVIESIDNIHDIVNHLELQMAGR